MLAVVLPGRAYDVTMPILAAVTDVLEGQGYDVLPISWSLQQPPRDPAAFVTERLVAATTDGCDLVVGKSLGTWGARYAAERAWPAVWLTPVLTDLRCAAGIRAGTAPQLVVAGLADPFHDAEVAAGLGCELLELEGLDHALHDVGADRPAAAVLTRVADTTADFIRRLP